MCSVDLTLNMRFNNDVSEDLSGLQCCFKLITLLHSSAYTQHLFMLKSKAWVSNVGR